MEVSEFPVCTVWYCPGYFTPSTKVGLLIMFGRLSIAVLILLLGTKMEKDFLRSVTVAMFLPITVSELFTIYCESAAFASLFQTSEEDFLEFQEHFLKWTADFVYVLYDYIEFNCALLLVLLVHCARLACQPIPVLHQFPVNLFCVLCHVTSLLCCLLLKSTDDVNPNIPHSLPLCINTLCLVIVLIQILLAFTFLRRRLPYEHAVSSDLQLRDARSRLALIMVYSILPTLSLLPFAVSAIISLLNVSISRSPAIHKMQIVCGMLEFLVHFYRPTWLVLLTVICLPPYRRAVPLLFCCCRCCPKIELPPLPRKPKETSAMYKHAD